MSGYLIHYGVLGMKWGVRKDKSKSNKTVKSRGSLTNKEAAECISLARKIKSVAESNEPKVSSIIKDSVANIDAKLYGFENRLKTLDSIAAKIGSDSKDKNISFEEASKRLNDSLRYTVISGANKFVGNYERVKNDLNKLGIEEAACKNYFEKYRLGESQHKSVTSVFKLPDGFKFEIQFHTPESQKVKNEKEPLYEEVRKKSVSSERKKEIESEMHKLGETISDPKGISRIISHSNEVHNMGGYLIHYGVPGQKWGVRRYQNPDGSLTPAGMRRQRNASDMYKKLSKIENSSRVSRMSNRQYKSLKKAQQYYYDIATKGSSDIKRSKIVRNYDLIRSNSFTTRATKLAAGMLIGRFIGRSVQSLKLKEGETLPEINGKEFTKSFAKTVVGDLVFDEFVARVSGHF